MSALADRPAHKGHAPDTGREDKVREALVALVEGVEGERWPRWLGHLPWDVRAQYRRKVEEARAALDGEGRA